MKRIRFALGGGLVALGAAAAASSCAPAQVVETCAAGEICVKGTARYLQLEGGFWTVRGDDSVTYDPMNGLPEAFRQEGLRVFMRARQRTDMGSIHMSGPIVEIITLRKLD